jgi:putative DNA primase/helicase
MAENLAHCDPPLAETEINQIAGSVVRYPRKYHLSDLGNARRLVARHSNKLRYVKGWDWNYWNGRFWERDESGHVFRLAKETVISIYSEAARTASPDERKLLVKHAMRSEAANRINAMIKLAASEPEFVAHPEDFDTHLWLLNCKNGTLDLRTAELKRHDPLDLITKITAVGYDPAAKCPVFLTFLDDIMRGDEAMIGFLQRSLGSCSCGANLDQVLFLWFGYGANGKTTLIEAVRRPLGDYALQTPAQTLLPRASSNIPNDLARLPGARFVAAVETEQGKRMAEALVKQLTGQDTVAARYLYKEFFEFVPQFKIVLSTNHLPVIRGSDHAIWRRIRLVPFAVTIPTEKQDKALLEKLQAEAEGILAWLVEGCLKWQESGLAEPEKVLQETENYRISQDLVGQFLDECVADAEDKYVAASELYGMFKWWLKRGGERRLAQRVFGETMTEKGYERVKKRKGKGDSKIWFYIDLKIRQQAQKDYDDYMANGRTP